MKRFLIPLAIFGSLLCSCKKETDGDREYTEEEYTRLYVNTVAYNVMNTWYLWNEEISDGLKSWGTQDDPVEKVKTIRYKDSNGKDIDRWTTMIEDFETYTSSVQGTGKTYGYEFQAYYYDSSKTTVCTVVTLVYPGTPAAEAGLKRGDAIVKVNGSTMTEGNYQDLMVNGLIYSDSCNITLSSGNSLTMSSKVMYEDPVIMYKTFDVNGKKVGYMFYNAFTIDSYSRLIEACSSLKKDGVRELVLDLRYNGGGYALTEQTFESMLAPEKDVKAGCVSCLEVYNSILKKYYGSGETCFKTDFDFSYSGKQYKYSTKDANLGLDHIYVIMTGGSASASESLITCLKPYIGITLIGEQSYGKYCSGIMYSANDWYDDYKSELSATEYSEGLRYADNWGIYVMISRFADKNGDTPCMPNGFTPDISVRDNPIDGYQLGDENETMLKAALGKAGKIYSTKAGSAPVPEERRRISFEYPKARVLIGSEAVSQSGNDGTTKSSRGQIGHIQR